jgi:hypothetical protein
MDIQGIIDTILGGIAHIGDMFGEMTGLRIGGPLITGVIVILVIWKLSKRLPSWVKWLLILAAIVMLSGGIANLPQVLEKVRTGLGV